MTQMVPIPTPGQKLASHVVVGVASGALIHATISDLKVSPQAKVVVAVLSGAGAAYAHHKLDAPVAQWIAIKAA